MDIINEMELEATTISERRLIAVCWWTLYAMSFKDRDSMLEHMVYVRKVVDDFVALDK